MFGTVLLHLESEGHGPSLFGFPLGRLKYIKSFLRPTAGLHGEDEELSGTDEDQDRIEEVHEHQAFEMVIGPLGSQDHHPDQHVNHIDTLC